MLSALILFLADAPSAQAIADARAIAEVGALVTVGDMATAKETEDKLAAHPDLTEAEKATFRAIAGETAAVLRSRAIEAVAQAYLGSLTPAQLAAIAAFTRSDAALAQRAAMPQIMAATMQNLTAGGGIDFMGETTKVFCAKTGKLCEGK